MKYLIRRAIFSVNIIAGLLLLGSYLSVYISPEESWIFALFGLAYPFLLLLNVFFALFWLFQFRLQALFSMALIVAGAGLFSRTFRFSGKDRDAESEFRIVSYNAGLFGYFQSAWHRTEMSDKIRSLNPDIVCIQEFLNISGAAGNTVDSIARECGYRHRFFQKLKDGRKRGEYGMAVFSRFPILKTELVQFDGLTGNMCLSADLRIRDSIYRLYNVHLQSFKFKRQDYNFIRSMPEDNEEKIRQSKGLLKRMKDAYIKRAEQVSKIRRHMDQSRVPVFVVGDFNDPPVSYSYSAMSSGLSDAFVEAGSGMGKTYIGLMPNFRIDYVLFPENMEACHYRNYKLSSDHSLVCAGLKFKK